MSVMTTCFLPGQPLNVRGKLSISSKQLMEIADISYIQAADLVTADEESTSMNLDAGVVTVYTGYEPGATSVAELVPHTRFHVCDAVEMEDSSRKVLLVLEGDDKPLGWATAITKTGIPLMHVCARPLYEVAKWPLKLRTECEPSSRIVQVIQPGTRLHVVGARRIADGTQRVCACLIGDTARALGEAAGWVTARSADGRQMIRVVETQTAASRPSALAHRPAGNGKYDGMSFEALDKAAQLFLRERSNGTLLTSVQLEAAAETEDARAGEYDARAAGLRRSYIEDGGLKPLGVLLSEVLRDADLSADEFMKAARGDASAGGKNAEGAGVAAGGTKAAHAKGGLIDRTVFRKYVKALLSGHGLRPEDAHIDALFPSKASSLGDDGQPEALQPAGMAEIAQMLEELHDMRVAHEAAAATESAQASACRERAAAVRAVSVTTRCAEEAVRAHKVAHAQLHLRTARFGGMLASKGEGAAAMAASMVAEGPVDRKAFRKRCDGDVALAGLADGELERLFDELKRRLLGEEVSSCATLDAAALERGFALLMAEAAAARQAMRERDIEVIEACKAVNAAQSAHRAKSVAWEKEAAAEAERVERAKLAQAHADAEWRSKLRRARTQRTSKDLKLAQAPSSPGGSSPGGGPRR